MKNRHKFRPALDGLEGRLALSAMAAGVVQQGDFQGQFGDQTTPDAPGTGGERIGEAPERIESLQPQSGGVPVTATRATRGSNATPHRPAHRNPPPRGPVGLRGGGGTHRAPGRHR